MVKLIKNKVSCLSSSGCYW